MNSKIKDVEFEGIIAEIEELHQFFENWFNGSIAQDRFTRFENVTSPNFLLITPRSETFDRFSILMMVRQGYNTHSNRKIWTENIQVRKIESLYLTTYHELQEVEERKTERISTAIFSEKQDAINGCIWEHVHETWINE